MANDIEKTLNYIHFIATKARPDRRSQCFCGSRLKFRNCHRKTFDKLKRIGENALLMHRYLIGKQAGLFK